VLAQSALAVPIALWLLHGYLQGIPEDLEEAAMIDGCSRLATVPVALLFSFVQGVFVRGITAGAVKG